MKRYLGWLAAVLILVMACKSKKNAEDKTGQKEDFFPVLSYLKSQVAGVDTSLYSIRKISIIDSVHSDTSFVPREQFRGLAKDFLGIPDLADKQFKSRYKEEKLFDESINRVIITYTPLDPEKEEVQKQEVLISPDPSGDKVYSFFIDRVTNSKDSFFQKKMLWEVDKSFQVTTTTQKPSQPETTTTLKVTWE
jgi:hypothetical protein